MKVKNLIKKLFIKFASEELPGCDFEIGTGGDPKRCVVRWLQENDRYIDRCIKELRNKNENRNP